MAPNSTNLSSSIDSVPVIILRFRLSLIFSSFSPVLTVLLVDTFSTFPRHSNPYTPPLNHFRDSSLHFLQFLPVLFTGMEEFSSGGEGEQDKIMREVD